VNKCKSGERRY